MVERIMRILFGTSYALFETGGRSVGFFGRAGNLIGVGNVADTGSTVLRSGMEAADAMNGLDVALSNGANAGDFAGRGF